MLSGMSKNERIHFYLEIVRTVGTVVTMSINCYIVWHLIHVK
jgi:hypothetical protein